MFLANKICCCCCCCTISRVFSAALLSLLFLLLFTRSARRSRRETVRLIPAGGRVARSIVSSPNLRDCYGSSFNNDVFQNQTVADAVNRDGSKSIRHRAVSNQNNISTQHNTNSIGKTKLAPNSWSGFSSR